MNDSPRIVYAGTPEFALPPLQALYLAGVEISAVYTQPDRKAGRGRKISPSPVKAWSLEHGLSVEQPEKLSNKDAITQLAGYTPDLMVVVAYGLILPPEVLAIPRCGCVNLHASLLPRWRGAAPIQRAIMSGDTETGVTLMQMDAGLDTGMMLAKRAVKLAMGESSDDVHDKLVKLAADLLQENILKILNSELVGEQQDDRLATKANKIKKDEAWIDWNQSAKEIACKVAAFNSWPVAQTLWKDQILRIWRAEPADSETSTDYKPGEVVSTSSNGIDVACGKGVLRVVELQLPGARVVHCSDFINAHTLSGTALG